jgi:4-hydroxybenzoate polyprenyltransferase
MHPVYTSRMSEASRRIADAAPHGWVEQFTPARLLPYAQLMRLDRPIGWWLLLLPCWWGMLLAHTSAGDARPDWFNALLFLAGAVAMRGAGCVGNDIVDRKFDAQVARTRSRPIPSGRVSLGSAAIFLFLLSMIGLLVLLQFNQFTIWLGISSLAIVAIYPFMKRITYWPQAVLGLAFNWGALVGWSATVGSLQTAVLLLYAGGFFWTLAYDTIYAHQDIDDDILIGVKSTALLFGSHSRLAISLFFATCLVCLAAAAFTAGAGVFAYAGLAAAAAQAIWQVQQFQPGNSTLALRLFKSNRTLGLFVAAGFLMDVVF